MSDGGSLEVSASRAGQLAEQARAEIDRLESQNTSISMQEYGTRTPSPLVGADRLAPAAITNTLSSLRRQVKQTQSLSQREIVAEKRQRAKELASKLNEELTQLQQRCDRLRPAPSSGSNSPALHSQGSRASDMDTEELFRRTNGERATVRMDTSIQISDRILQERDSMYRAASQIDDYIASGANTLSSLQNQRSTLKVCNPIAFIWVLNVPWLDGAAEIARCCECDRALWARHSSHRTPISPGRMDPSHWRCCNPHHHVACIYIPVVIDENKVILTCDANWDSVCSILSLSRSRWPRPPSKCAISPFATTMARTPCLTASR